MPYLGLDVGDRSAVGCGVPPDQCPDLLQIGERHTNYDRRGCGGWGCGGCGVVGVGCCGWWLWWLWWWWCVRRWRGVAGRRQLSSPLSPSREVFVPAKSISAPSPPHPTTPSPFHPLTINLIKIHPVTPSPLHLAASPNCVCLSSMHCIVVLLGRAWLARRLVLMHRAAQRPHSRSQGR